MFCGQCGTQVPDGQSVCSVCGNNFAPTNNSYQQYFSNDNAQAASYGGQGVPNGQQGFTGQQSFYGQQQGFATQQQTYQQQPYQQQAYQQQPYQQQPMDGQTYGQSNANEGYQQGMPNPSQQPYYQQTNYQGGFDFSKFLNTTINQLKAGARPEALKAKMIAYIGLAVAFISLFLPAVSVSVSLYVDAKSSASFLSFNGPWVLILILVTTGLLLCNYDKYALISVGISALFLASVLLDVLTASSATSMLGGFAGISLSFGFFLVLLGLAAVPVYYFLPRFKQQ